MKAVEAKAKAEWSERTRPSRSLGLKATSTCYQSIAAFRQLSIRLTYDK